MSIKVRTTDVERKLVEIGEDDSNVGHVSVPKRNDARVANGEIHAIGVTVWRGSDKLDIAKGYAGELGHAGE